MQDTNFQDSLVGVMESNMARNPIYFNCYPNLELSCIRQVIHIKHLNQRIRHELYIQNILLTDSSFSRRHSEFYENMFLYHFENCFMSLWNNTNHVFNISNN